MTLQIVAVDPRLIEKVDNVHITMPSIAYVGIDGDEVVGSGGLAWGEGRCWIFFRVYKSRAEYALPVMRQTKALIAKARQFGETAVFTPRDSTYSTSKKLLETLRFRMHEVQDGVEIWRCDIAEAS